MDSSKKKPVTQRLRSNSEGGMLTPSPPPVPVPTPPVIYRSGTVPASSLSPTYTALRLESNSDAFKTPGYGPPPSAQKGTGAGNGKDLQGRALRVGTFERLRAETARAADAKAFDFSPVLRDNFLNARKAGPHARKSTILYYVPEMESIANEIARRARRSGESEIKLGMVDWSLFADG